MNAAELLEVARSRISGTHTNDLGARMGMANLPFGLGKVLHLQERAGIPLDASFVATPDFSITRNRTRWQQGFGYGGVFSWSGDFIVLDLKPNTCGMLVGGLSRLPDIDAMERNLAALQVRGIEAEGRRAYWDFDSSNHFFQLYRAQWRDQSAEKPPYVFVLHGSGREMRDRLYFDHESFYLASDVEVADTPLGRLHVLEGRASERYRESYQEAELFSSRRRAAFAGAIVGEYETLSDSTHQGLLAQGRMVLGCVEARQGALYPLTLRENRPVWLMSVEGVEPLLLPHGGGYSVDEPFDAVTVEGTTDAERRVRLSGEAGEMLVEDIRSLRFGYRYDTVLDILRGLPGLIFEARLEPLWRITWAEVRPIHPELY